MIEDDDMFSISHLLYALGAFYGVVGLVLVLRAQKPTCHICAYRVYCPIRQRSLWDPSIKRCYDASKPMP
jgi:hypothetical protein